MPKELTQKNRILNLLQTQRRVPAYRMSAPRPDGEGVLQYGARILELRREGYNILNKTDESGYTYFELEPRNLVQQLQEEYKAEHQQEERQLGLL